MSSGMDPSLRREALRQQLLLRALWGDAPTAAVQGWLAGEPARQQRGLQAYRANAGALAERALAAAFPTVAELVGETSFAALARAFWHAQPPHDGDIAEWGAALPGFIAADAQLAEEPYLADVAGLDWAVHLAERAADDTGPPDGLEQLAAHEPAQLRLHLRAGHAVLQSAHPLHAIHAAHRSSAEDRFAPVRQAWAEQRQDSVRVWRRWLVAQVERIDAATARFEAALLAGRSLGAALEAGAAFDFEPWLLDSLREGRIARVTALPEPGASSP